MSNPFRKSHKLLLILFNIILAILIIWSLAYSLMTSNRFYKYEFEKQDVVSRTGFTEYQLNLIGDHIIKYLIDEEESLQIKIGGKDVFSNQALYHMEDVKSLFLGIQHTLWYIFVLWVIIGIYIYVKRKDFKKHFFKYKFIVYISILIAFIILGIIVLIDFNFAFDKFHRLIFWDEQSYRDSFFTSTSHYPEALGIDNRMLVKILPQGLFSDAAAIIIGGTLLLYGINLIILYIYNRRQKGIN